MDLVRAYALSFLNAPYKFGGETIDGIDCSGLVQVILKSAGIDPPGDQTAQDLLNHFDKAGTYGKIGLGSLAFYGKSVTQVGHVAFMIDNYRIIEAAGGDALTITRADAVAKNAFVRIRLLKYRPDLVAVIKPSYVTIGYM